MNKGRNYFALFFVICLVFVYCVACSQDESIAGKNEAEKTEVKSTDVKAAPAAEVQEKAVGKVEAQSIEAQAEIDNNHPPIEPGYTCVDCHEIKLDANTTATQNWLYAETPGQEANEGVMPEDVLLKEVRKAIGGIKMESKTFVLGTSMNNRPLTTTAEFTLDPEKMVLYGFHEQGTEKLTHIKKNPYVSMNYHKEFVSFDVFLCCQILGRAELIDAENPEYEQLMINLLPYEDGARVPKDATPEQREEHLRKFRQGLKKGFYISKITIDRLTLINLDMVKQGYRRVQRWERKK